MDAKIAAYIANQAQKKAMRVAKKLKSAPTLYSNASNPFGDSNLTGRFIWKKKIERDVSLGTSLESYTVKSEKKRQREAMAEIQKLKKRREERALERLRRQEETALLARERAQAEFQDWEKKEEEFDLEQRKLRSEIRLREKRAKPIDILTKHLAIDSSDDDLDAGPLISEPPYTVFDGLTVEEMEEVRDDIVKSTVNPTTARDAEYWKALLEVCNWELAEARLRDRALLHGKELRGLHASIEEDVQNQLESKTHKELEELHSRVEEQLSSGMGKEVEFWEVVVKRIHIYKAKAYLREFHGKTKISGSSRVIITPTPNNDDASSPINNIEADDDSEQPEEAVFGSEYGLRKPKYYNRMHTGYEWNKYNRTHYDHDNPPPKVVQGYKFNIYYPDLVDKSKAPTYTVEEDVGSRETCIIRFHAGAPYEDVGFRIVNRDWEYSRKKGFKSSFEGGVLKVYFNFKRYGYRR